MLLSFLNNSSLSLVYTAQCRSTCSIVSASLHVSHNPDWCFPIVNNELFKPECPILSRVNIKSSFLLLKHILPLPTCFWILYKCLPFKYLSHISCHFLLMCSLIFPFISTLLSGICTSTLCFIACLDNLSTISCPCTPICAGTGTSRRLYQFPES